MRIPALSWRQKLITTSLLCLVLPSIITLALTGFQTKAEFKKKAVLKAEQSLEVADLYVSNLVDDMLINFNSIQYDSELITALRSASNKYDKDKTGIVDFFYFKRITEKLDHLSLFGERSYITILLPNGLYFTNYSTYKMDLSQMYDVPWLEEMANAPINTTRWLGAQDNYVYSDINNSPNIVTIVRTIRLFAGSPNAYIILSRPEEQFHQIFSKYAPDQIMMLQDAEGRIISQPDRQLLGTKLPQPVTRGKDNLVHWNGKDYISVEYPLRYAGWNMQSLTSYQDVTGNISSIMNYTFIQQIIFFLVFSIVMLYLLRQLTFPIIRLAKTARKVEADNLDIRSEVRGRDEVGQLGLYFDKMLDRIKEMVRQIELEQNRKRIAEIELLQAQINPHFLFNTLNSIQLQVMMKGENEIAQMIGSLSTLLRMTINRNNEFLPLHEEVRTVEHYMKLMNFRHLERVQLTINLASDTLLEMVPRFTLQPLIENAYIHGLSQKQGEISVSSRSQGNSLYLTVQDDGKGMTREELDNVMSLFRDRSQEDVSLLTHEQESGIGLRNVHERLRIIYGSAYDITLESEPGRGLKITLRIPISAKGEGV
ncbi:cache domain-containing sensor histidine kinase [Paenibacillus paeoniae]|uniref:histidine kinase n=1 Tax=Paenibacillus paeoniae TaxID=2292705 RepID=A0A371PE32_9BACL|nr:histidine kinase [Paenibacillus paeoniae]REK74182.1 sensor histidine kinase [Paenibacillus paeoniae]